MNAQLKPKSSPPTVAAARDALAAHESELLAVRRQNASARNVLATSKAAGDEEGERQCRRTIALTAKQIEVLLEAIDLDKETVAAMLKRDIAEGNGKRLRNLETLATRMISTSAALEDLAVQFAAARLAAHQAASEFEGALSIYNVNFDAFSSVATRLDGRAELLLNLETGGALGRARTLETPMQLRESKRASLHHAAAEFSSVALRTARATLGLG